MPVPDEPRFTPTAVSPLTGLPEPAAGITLEERAAVGKVNLRGDAASQTFLDAVRGVVGCVPPTTPNSVTTAAPRTIFWLGPDEWQIHCPGDDRAALVASLSAALAGEHSAMVDVSDYYVLMRLCGEQTLAVLAKGTPLDLHPRVFAAGTCAQTRFGHATVLLHKRADDCVDLQVRWSFAEYVWRYIVAGTREYR